jgi:hypothetical protein
VSESEMGEPRGGPRRGSHAPNKPQCSQVVCAGRGIWVIPLQKRFKSDRSCGGATARLLTCWLAPAVGQPNGSGGERW